MSRKAVLGAGVAVLVIVIVAIVAVVLIPGRLDRYVLNEIEAYGRATTGTDVSVGGVNIAITKGTGDIDRLTIGNPRGFSTDYALRLNDIRLAVDLKSVTAEVPVVKDAVVDGAHLNIEQRGDATNLTQIQDNMTHAQEPETPPGEEGRITIERFRLTRATVTLTSELLDKPETLELDDVVVQGIGRNGGATYDEATRAILTPILAAARSAAQERLRKEATEAAKDEAKKKAGEKLKDLLDRH